MSTRKRTSHISPTNSEVIPPGSNKRAHMGTAGTDEDPHVVLSSSDEGGEVHDPAADSFDAEIIGHTSSAKMDGIVETQIEEHLPSVVSRDYKGNGRRPAAHLPTPPVGSPPPPSTAAAGPSVARPATLSPARQWTEDFKKCKEMWGGKDGGYVHEDASGEAMIKKLRAGDGDNSISCSASFLDEEDTAQTLGLNITITELDSYPHSYSIYIYPEEDSPPKHLAECLEYYPPAIRSLTLPQLVRKVVRSLQGEAMSEAPTLDDTDGSTDGDAEDEDAWADFGGGRMGGGKKSDKGLKGVRADAKVDFDKLKRDFKEIVAAGYRPGLFRISDDEIIISVSALLRDLSVPVETLERWDERLGQAHSRSRLILLMNIGPSYPPKRIGSEWQKPLSKPSFWVGMGEDYKPSLETIKKTCWKFSAKPLVSLASELINPDDHPSRPSDFLPFLLSAPLASLLNEQFLVLINSRTRMTTPMAAGKKTEPKFGWAAMEKLIAESSSAGGTGVETKGATKEFEKQMKQADKDEKALKRSLPKDSWSPTSKDNYGLLAFEYLLRRFTLSTKFCLNCYNPVEVESLRPYVCSKELCVYAYQGLGLGPPVEYEIRENHAAVDLLVTFAYTALKEGNENSLPDGSYPIGLHIDVEPKLMTTFNLPESHKGPSPPALSFDELETLAAKKEALITLIEQLPRISDLRDGLVKGKTLAQIGPDVPRGAWGTLRWIVASNTSYLKETAFDERITSIPDSEYRQFKFVVGSPAKEVAFKEASAALSAKYAHTNTYPSILAFHGSPARNWHNILRVGLNHNYIGNARAYGHGIYFAIDGQVSMGVYAQAAAFNRPNADFIFQSASALVEIVNAREEFVSKAPYLVVADPSWCQPRSEHRNTSKFVLYNLVVKGNRADREGELDPAPLPPVRVASLSSKACTDPTYRLAVGTQEVMIAQNESRVRLPSNLVDADDWTIEDRAIIFGTDGDVPMEAIELSSDDDDPVSDLEVAPAFVPSGPERLERCHLLPPPTGTATATRALTLAFKALVAEQSGKSPGGVYVDPESDSLYSWVVELHSFPHDSHLHKDLVKRNLPSVLVEIRYPASFPFSPPFVRILHPRMMNFAAGGGGHITAGGSICSELLTATGWNSCYTISAVLTELATNMTVAPEAKLDPTHWDNPYTSHEAAEAYKRVALQHGWAVPTDFAKLF